MKITKSERGFEELRHESYPEGKQLRVVSASSIIGDYEDAFDRPGTSALWIGDNHHMNREEVRELIKYLQAWVDTGSLKTSAGE